jgi:aspartyl/asparaginyl-tRNA synthetase
MLGPYQSVRNGAIRYRGNARHAPIEDIRKLSVPLTSMDDRVRSLHDDRSFSHLARINHRIFVESTRFFGGLDAHFTLLPLTTRMISSPGAVYGRHAVSYTTDTCPITVEWFDLDRPGFLSESSQIYLELALAQPGVDRVYSIYNSFRREEADATHLSEFHHIEFEAVGDQAGNVDVALALLRTIVDGLVEQEEESLTHFLDPSRLVALQDAVRPGRIVRLTFAEALEILREDTGSDLYASLTLDGTFGPWEEVRLTEITGGLALVSELPLLEVPFYHSQIPGSDPPLADCTDFIWPGYREILGSGRRIRDAAELFAKAELFELPPDDYEPYLATRRLPAWPGSAGFGLGWERFVQGVLELPAIWDAAHFPRTHLTLRP